MMRVTLDKNDFFIYAVLKRYIFATSYSSVYKGDFETSFNFYRIHWHLCCESGIL